MTEPRTRPGKASVEAFLARQPEARRADCEAIVAIMRKATGEAPVMWGESIVGFGRYASTRSDGKVHEWPVTGFSPRKNDLTLYITPGFDNYESLLDKLGKHRTGKSCLYIKRLSDVDGAVLEALVRASVEAMAPKRVRKA
jgi:hypothetical protein